jgi:diguanylate cyclase (GGDEF)-like protein/PAS domain S-box-containing protein
MRMDSQTDITERRTKDEMLNLSRVVFESAEEGIMVTDAERRIVMVNPAFTSITGYLPDEVIGRDSNMMSSGHHDQLFYQSLWDEVRQHGSWHGEIANRHKSGRHYLEWLSIRAVIDPQGRTTHYVGIFSDITERKEGEERMRYLAHYDALTGLPNRTLLMDRLQQGMAQTRRDNGRMAVMFLDLDRFKPVNDQLGHETGDRLLCEVAMRLQNCMRESDTVGRIGGDEFVILLHGIEHSDAAILVARKIIKALEQPFDLGNHAISISASIGIALYPDHDGDESMLIKMADIAMYEAKSEKSGHFRLFDLAMLVSQAL